MLKITFSKIRKICSVSLIPRILRDEFTLSPSKLGKRPLNGFWKMNKSSDSKNRQAECEKCKKLIEMVFGPEKQDPVLKQVEANLEDIHMDKLQKAIAPIIPMKDKLNEKDGLTADVLPVKDTKKDVNIIDNAQPALDKPIDKIGLDNLLQATTLKENKEELAQKLETIEEPVLVEAATPKIEGFNTPPKVLGNKETIFDTKNSLCTKIGPEEDAIDEIAKKCLGSPPDKIDERIIEEMKSCGMLGRGRRKSSRRHGSYTTRANRKEALLETKSDESTLYCEKEQIPINPLHVYPSIRCQNMKFNRNMESLYPAYYKNVPLHIIGDGHSNLKTNEQENTVKEEDKEKTIQLSTDSSALVESYQQIPVATDRTCMPQEEVTEVIVGQKSESLQIVAHEENNPQKPTEKEQVIDEIHVTAAEIEVDDSQQPAKPEILLLPLPPDILTVDKFIEAEKQESYVAYSNVQTPDGTTTDIPGRPFNQPNTAISGTYIPQKEPKPEAEIRDTAISSNQNPGEYYDFTSSEMEKLDLYAINPSIVRPLEAYHPYTIISGTDNPNKSQNLLLSATEPINENISDSQLSPQVRQNLTTPAPSEPLPSATTSQVEKIETTDIPSAPTTINKNISTTTGPLPQVKDMEEELSLSEMLKRVRERNRLQFYRECEYKLIEAEPAEETKYRPTLGKDPPKTLGPQTCKPKPKPAPCPPAPPKCPPPPQCPPPQKKDPCAKFTKTSLIGYKIKEAFSLVLNVGLKPTSDLPLLAYNCKVRAIEPLKQLRIVEDTRKADWLGSFLLSNCLKRKSKPSENKEVILAKDYEPWIPIPSWPIPEKEKKEPFVCPKEGCKIIPPPRLNPPCKENPCINMPKRSFSLIERDFASLY